MNILESIKRLFRYPRKPVTSGLISVQSSAASVAPTFAVFRGFVVLRHFERIYVEKIQPLGYDKNKWICDALAKFTKRTLRVNLTDDWDIDFAWDMWKWFVEGLDKGLIGDKLFEYISDQYEETIIAKVVCDD